MVSVLDILRPIRRPKLDRIEGIAARIAADDVPPASEIVAVLDASRCSEADLQTAVDRHRRVAEHRRTIEYAAPAAKRFATLDAQVKAATAALEKARRESEAVMEKVSAEHFECKMRVDAASRAVEELLRPENLPPAEAVRIAAAEDGAAEASEAAVAVRDELATCRRSLDLAESKLIAAEHEAKVSKANGDIQAEAERWRNAIKARSERVKATEATLRNAEAAAADANRRLAEAHAAIRKTIMA